MSPLHGVIGREQLEGLGTAFGGTGTPPDPNPFPRATKLRMFSGSLSAPGDLAVAEDLLTRSLHGGGVLEKKGDVIVLDREGAFDKKGEYHVYLYYAELTEDLDTKNAGSKKDSGESE